MKAEVLKDNKPMTTFTKTSMEEQMKIQAEHVYTHKQTKNKFNGLRQTYKRLKKLVNHTCRDGWDHRSRTINLVDVVLSVLLHSYITQLIIKRRTIQFIMISSAMEFIYMKISTRIVEQHLQPT